MVTCDTTSSMKASKVVPLGAPVWISRLTNLAIRPFTYSILYNANSPNSGGNLHKIAYTRTVRFDEDAVRYSENKQKQQLGHTKEKRWWQADHYLQGGIGYHETTRVCSYVLSRPGSVRSVDRSRGFRLKGVRLRQDRARRRRGRRAGIPVEGVVDESGLRHTLAAVPESALFMQRITRGIVSGDNDNACRDCGYCSLINS